MAFKYQREEGLQLIDLLQLKGCTKILDIGCSTGELSSVIAKKIEPQGGTVTAVDINKERLSIARKKYEEVKNIIFVEGDHMNFPVQEYNVVILANFVMHWIENKNEVFSSAFSNLKRGGSFAFNAVDNYGSPLHEISCLINPDKGDKYFYFESSEAYKQLSTAHGFTVSYCEEKPFQYQWNNIDEAIDWLSANTYGALDPSVVDPVVMDDFKKLYSTEPCSLEDVNQLKFILTKP